MQGSLVMSTQRDPDFFALYRLQGGLAECWVTEGEKEGLTAMGAVLVREGFLDAVPAKVGYLGDLRTGFAAQRRRDLSRFYGQIFEGARARHGCDVFLTAVLASNAPALQALVRRRRPREGQPWYHLLRRFSLVSIPYLGRRFRRSGGFSTRHASEADLPELERFLAADHGRRPFGYRFDLGELRWRLAHWPGFTLRRTYLVHEGARLLACATAWDPSPVKRYRVEAYRGAMRWKKLLLDGVATLAGGTRLPSPGESFRTLYLCNLSVADERPAPLRALLEHVYADTRKERFHLLSLPIYEGDPLAPAVNGFYAQRVDFHLYAVSSALAPRTEFSAGRPGFEPALA